MDPDSGRSAEIVKCASGLRGINYYHNDDYLATVFVTDHSLYWIESAVENYIYGLHTIEGIYTQSLYDDRTIMDYYE